MSCWVFKFHLRLNLLTLIGLKAISVKGNTIFWAPFSSRKCFLQHNKDKSNGFICIPISQYNPLSSIISIVEMVWLGTVCGIISHFWFLLTSLEKELSADYWWCFLEAFCSILPSLSVCSSDFHWKVNSFSIDFHLNKSCSHENILCIT